MKPATAASAARAKLTFSVEAAPGKGDGVEDSDGVRDGAMVLLEPPALEGTAMVVGTDEVALATGVGVPDLVMVLTL